MEELKPKFQNVAAHLARILSQRDHKFICGDKLTTPDFTVGGLFLNLFINPNAKDTAFWATEMEAAPERVKQYVADLKEELKVYLTEREQHKSTI